MIPRADTLLLCGVAAICSAIAYSYLFRALNGDPVYRLDSEGLSGPSMRDWSLRWRDIRRVETFEIPYVAPQCLQPIPEALHRLNWLERAYGMGVMGVVIGPGAIWNGSCAVIWTRHQAEPRGGGKDHI